MGKLRYLVRRRPIEQGSKAGQHVPVTLGNITPLAVKPLRPGKLALVYEDGGQRGIFTTRVLDEFMRAGFSPFDLMLGTSADTQNLSTYMCSQQDHTREVITHCTISRQLSDPMRFVHDGDPVDLDWLVEAISRQMPLAMNYAEAQFMLERELWLYTRRGDDCSASYFSPTSQTRLDLIRALGAIPGFYRSGVLLDGISYLDGDVSNTIPVQETACRGVQTIVAIHIVPSQMFYTPQQFKRMECQPGESSLQPLVNLVRHHGNTYRATQQFIERPPGRLRIFEIYPQRPLRNMTFGSRLSALLEDCKTGRQCGRYFLATMDKLLADQPPLLRHAPRIVRLTPVVVSPVPVANGAPRVTAIPAPQANDASFDYKDLA